MAFGGTTAERAIRRAIHSPSLSSIQDNINLPDCLSNSPYVKLKVVEALSTGPSELDNSVQKQHGDLEQEKNSSISSVFFDDVSQEVLIANVEEFIAQESLLNI
ncbi:hypothetical protein OPV22_001936 [Ensete ventricosum]|uniref:Uncharacterized protein n=1 Tax=Ensete ventricosum TaxID=4639 RepID=A0AAV8RV25_ENSVE|nr:hypothetical protein OPV22_001936 [Ensete ventricosum]